MEDVRGQQYPAPYRPPYGAPEAVGLYVPRFEHENCGVGFVAHIKNQKSHAIIEQGLLILQNLEHRGATGYDPLLGDGAGILVQIPDQFLREEMAQQGVNLPLPGAYSHRESSGTPGTAPCTRLPPARRPSRPITGSPSSVPPSPCPA